jgi:hypothetical protein
MTAMRQDSRAPLSLGDFVLRFMEYMRDARGVNSFPPFDGRPWHEFLYALKNKFKEALPFKISRFDWDGPYPRNQEFSAFCVVGMRTACGADRETGRIRLNIVLEEDYLDADYPKLAELAYQVALSTEGFFET